jgi:hypothetical protein
MQGDIMLPQRPERPKPAPKPKPIHHQTEPVPDFVLDEVDLTSSKKTSRALAAPHKHLKRFWAWWLSLGRNQRFAIIAGLLLIFGAGAIGWYYFIQPNSTASLTIIHHPKPKKPLTVPSPLTGVQVDPALAKRPVTGVMIENSDGARPQSGLQDAGVVYEAVAEAGITRFLALFQDAQPQYIGPVRSLRPYYIDYAAPYQATIVHVGGSPDALSQVSSGGYRNLDQFANAGYFSRVATHVAPHNVYTSFAKLDSANQRKGYTASLFTGWPRKADKKLKLPTAKTIDLAISSRDYYVHYDYNAAGNNYSRSEGGAAHLDLVSAADKTGVQLQPKVVVALIVPLSNGRLDATGAYYSNYQDTGSGTAYVFQDGGVTQGTWTKSDTSSPLTLQDANGAAIKLDAGQTWLTLVGSTGKVVYKP